MTTTQPTVARVAMISGAGSGIGLATAQAFAREGVVLALTHFGEVEAVEELRSAHPGGPEHVFARRVDVAHHEDAESFVAETVRQFGRVDVLATCAGVHRHGPSESLPWDLWDQVLDVNLTGTFALVRACLPPMLKQGSGTVVTFASELGLTGREEDAAYCASKGAVIAMTKALAREYAGRGISVNCVAPGPVSTPMMLASPELQDPGFVASLPIKRLGTPEEIAATVQFLASPGGAFFVGQVLSPNGGAVI